MLQIPAVTAKKARMNINIFYKTIEHDILQRTHRMRQRIRLRESVYWSYIPERPLYSCVQPLLDLALVCAPAD